MIEPWELSALAKSIARVMRDSIARAILGINPRLDSIEQRIKEIPSGQPGEPGPIGPPGQSIVGERGERGETGKDGKDGIIGKGGAPGLDGKSIVGERGEPGKEGKDGRDGRDGISKDGRDGTAGRDALDIEILPGIDPTKCYPRGTFATQDGGLLRASRNTDQVSDSFEKAGWVVIMDGISGINVDGGDDPRHLGIVITRTSGLQEIWDRRIPVPIYRGVYRDDGQYEHGDTVSRSGSVWHCNVDGTKVTPGAPNSADWTLCVKQGSPGKDADRSTPENPTAPVRLK